MFSPFFSNPKSFFPVTFPQPPPRWSLSDSIAKAKKAHRPDGTVGPFFWLRGSATSLTCFSKLPHRFVRPTPRRYSLIVNVWATVRDSPCKPIGPISSLLPPNAARSLLSPWPSASRRQTGRLAPNSVTTRSRLRAFARTGCPLVLTLVNNALFNSMCAASRGSVGLVAWA